MRVAPAFPLVLLSFLSACDSGAPNSPDGGAGTAITERTSRGSYSCRVARDRTDHSPRQWGSADSALVATSGGVAFLARRESEPSSPLLPGAAKLLVSSFGVDGTFGAATEVMSAGPEESGDVAGAPRGDGFALLWMAGQSLRFGAFDAQGKLIGQSREVIGGLPLGTSPRMVAGPEGGFGVVYEREVTFGVFTVHFLALDRDGALRAPERRLDGPVSGMYYARGAPAIVGGADGYTMIWADPAAAGGAIDFARASAAGAEMVPRRRIATSPGSGIRIGGVAGAGFAPATHGLVEVSGGYLAAWVESKEGPGDYGPNGNRGAWSVVRLARLDGQGRVQGTPALLRAPTDSIDEVEPALARFGDAVAVFWGRGSHIYICGGCVPDHRIDLLLVDPSDLTPLSDVVTVTNAGGTQSGGLLRRQVAVLGQSLLTTFRLTFHVHNTPGSATFACDRVN